MFFSTNRFPETKKNFTRRISVPSLFFLPILLLGCDIPAPDIETSAETSDYLTQPTLNPDLVGVHPQDRVALESLYDGIAGFSTNERRRVDAIEYAPFNFGLEFGDQEIAQIAKLRSLKSLTLPMMGNSMTDQGLKRLANLTELEVLMMHGSDNLTDEGYRHVASLTNLRALGLGMSSVEDSSLVQISELTNLIFLDVTGAPITDTGVQHLSKLQRLESLALVSTQISDKSMVVVAELPRLMSLDIRGCNITDAGLAQLANTDTLVELVAHPTENGGGLITDEGLAHLQKISTLKRVQLAGNPVTPFGVAKLQAALPGCEIQMN